MPHPLLDLKRGLERETLRLTSERRLSQRSHEAALGVSPHDPLFTLDFAENQLEIVTPPFDDPEALLASLKTLHDQATQRITPETLWLSSMPPPFEKEEIKLAYFGESLEDQRKQRYRKGLCHRYGKSMQIICGIHYNVSFNPAFWDTYAERIPSPLRGQALKNDVYFKTIRHFIRIYWLLVYLLGASPLCAAGSLKSGLDLSFLKTKDQIHYYGENATSLRLSELGYHNPFVPELSICFASLETYVQSLYRATHTPYPPYATIPEEAQLNAHYLQIENEYYAPIRPKPYPTDSTLSVTEQLSTGGVAYLEIRILDLNPLLPLGIDLPTLQFIDLFMVYCALASDEHFDLCQNKSNALHVSKFGLTPALRDCAEHIFQELAALATELNSPLHLDLVKRQQEKLKDPHLLPSRQILSAYD